MMGDFNSKNDPNPKKIPTPLRPRKEAETKKAEEKPWALPPPPPSLSEFTPHASRQVAIIYAGSKSNKTTASWKVQRVFLSHHSPFIREIFKKQAIQNQQHEICWPENAYDIIAIFVQWVYTAQLTTPTVEKEDAGKTISKYVRLWLMARDLGVTSLMNQSLYVIHQISRRFSVIAIEEFPRIWKGTSPGSSLRSYFLELCCQLPATFFTSARCEKFSKTMLMEMMATMVGQKDIQNVIGCLDPSYHLERFYV